MGLEVSWKRERFTRLYSVPLMFTVFSTTLLYLQGAQGSRKEFPSCILKQIFLSGSDISVNSQSKQDPKQDPEQDCSLTSVEGCSNCIWRFLAGRKEMWMSLIGVYFFKSLKPFSISLKTMGVFTVPVKYGLLELKQATVLLEGDTKVFPQYLIFQIINLLHFFLNWECFLSVHGT